MNQAKNLKNSPKPDQASQYNVTENNINDSNLYDQYQVKGYQPKVPQDKQDNFKSEDLNIAQSPSHKIISEISDEIKEERKAKVNRIKEEIENNSYNIDSIEVAKAILSKTKKDL